MIFASLVFDHSNNSLKIFVIKVIAINTIDNPIASPCSDEIFSQLKIIKNLGLCNKDWGLIIAPRSGITDPIPIISTAEVTIISDNKNAK